MIAPGTVRHDVAKCLQEGMNGQEVYSALAGRASRNTLMVTMHEVRKILGLKAPRPGRERTRFAVIKLPRHLDRALRFEAEERGQTVESLTLSLLEKVVSDDLVDAVLDDGAAR